MLVAGGGETQALPAPPPPPARGPNPRDAGLWPERYELIDGWRGLAALAVVVHHVAAVFIGGPAVMLFFVISGYCIAASVDSCQRKGLGLGQFMLRRVRRIYPPYLLSIAFWAATRVIKLIQTGDNDLARPWLHWVQNITLTQWLSLVADPVSYAATNRTLFVAAYWSLCYEEQFYIVMGLMMLAAVRFGVSVRVMTAAMVALGLVFNALFPQTSFGIFLEYWALFGFGVLVFHRLCRIRTRRTRLLIDTFLLAVLAGSVYMRWFAGIAWAQDAPPEPGMDPMIALNLRHETRMVYGELTIAAGFSLLLVYTRALSPVLGRMWIYKPLAGLGLITFSLYLIHQFNLTLMSKVSGSILAFVPGPHNAMRAESPPQYIWYDLVLQIMLHIALAAVFWYFCERPFLNKSLLNVPGKGPTLAPVSGLTPLEPASPASPGSS